MMDMPFDPESLLEDVLGLGDGDPGDDAFELAVGPYIKGQLRVLEFEGAEYINDLYAYTVTCASHLPMEVLNAAADGEPACLTIKATGDHEPRLIQGIVESIEALGPPAGDRGTSRKRYRITIAPKLWLLTQRRTIRYFQYETPKQIIEKVLADIKIDPKECHWYIQEEEYPSLRFVYQRDETDYEFFRRVLSDAGIVFCFEHASGTLDSLLPGAGAVAGALGTVADMVGSPMGAAVEEAGAVAKMLTALVFTDDPQQLPAVQDMALANELVGNALKDLATKVGGDMLGDVIDAKPAGEIAFDDEAGGASDEERILEFGLKKRLRPKQIRMIDRDVGAARNWVGVAKKGILTPSFDIGAGLPIGRDGPSLAAHTGFDLDVDSPTIAPSMLLQQLYQLDPNLRAYGDKKKRADIELDRLRVQRIEGSGQSTCRRLAAGYRFRLTDHPVGTLNTEYTVTAVMSRGVADPASANDHVYRNTFVCVPVRIRPVPPRLPRPKLSDELARVVAVRGDRVTSYLDTNSRGYVHIRFDWEVIDDKGENYRDLAYHREHDNAVWVPVSQPWAGDGYGTQFLPREGMRVWVGFIEGQGERPFIKGCFYDAENRLPGAEDIEHQKVGIFSRTLPENGGHSEISISDERNQERVHIRAQRDLRVNVVSEARVTVGRNAIACVTGPASLEVTGTLISQIGQDERHMVVGERIEHVGGTATTIVGASNTTVKGAAQLIVDESRATGIKGNDVTTIAGRESTIVGTEEEPSESNNWVRGTYRLAAREIVINGDESIVLRVRGNEIRITEDALILYAKVLQAISKDELELISAHGPTLRLDKTAKLRADEVTVRGSKSHLKLDDNAELKGEKVELGKGGSSAKANTKHASVEEEVRIRVLELNGKVPLANATVAIIGPDGHRVEKKSDGDGWVTLKGRTGDNFSVVSVLHPTENREVAFMPGDE